MRFRKRFLSMLLVLCMVLSMLPAIGLTASAAIDASATWTETAWANIPDGATIIVANSNNVALPNATATGSGPLKVSITVSGSAGALTITPASGTLDDLVWTVNGNTTSSAGVQLLQYGSTTVNLCLSSTTSNNAVRVSTGTSNNKWVMGSSGKLLKVQNVDRYLGEYVAGSDWRSYNSETATNYSGQSLVFYVLNSTPASYTLTYSENGVTSSETYTAGETVSLKKAASEDGYTFIGWSTKAVPTPTDTKPTTLITSQYTMPSADTTLYAVYAKATEGTGTSYTKTDISNIQAADKVVITAKTSDGTLYAMTNNNGTSSPSAVDISNNVVDTMMWNILKLGDDLIIYPDGTTDTWLYCTNSNTGVSVGTNGNNIFQIDSSSGYLKNIATDRYLGVYATNADWRCYTSPTSTNIKDQTFDFYVKAATYTGYTTSPAATTQLTGDITATLVSEEAQMVAGDYYLLISYDTTNSTLYAASNTPNQNNLGVVTLDTTLSARPQVVTIPGETVAQIYTFVLEGTSGAWKLKDGLDGYLYKSPIKASNNLSNILRMSKYSYTTTADPEIADGADEWSLVFPWENMTNEKTGLVNNAYTDYHVRLNHNSGNPIFSAYTTYTHNPAYLYHVDTLPLTVNIRCGEGEVSMLKNGEVIASTNTAGTPDKTYVSTGDEITLVMKPGDGYRLATAEKGSFRIFDSAAAPANAKYTWTWDETYGGYIFKYTVAEINPQDNSSNYYNVSFLPRRMDTGITAVQATGLKSGLYVITGVPYAQNTAPDAATANNLHDAASTYLLYGDDGLAGDVVGRKSAAMRLSDINVTLNSTSPYLMTGLNEACLYEIEAGTGSYAGYYTIRMCGATSELYLTCTGDGNDKLAATALTDTATASSYWTITIDSNGVAKIQNKVQTTRFLKFAGDGNYQFRTYKETTNGSVWPVLYKATQSAYTVSYSKEGSGTVKAYNTTTGSDVVSGSVQSAGNSIRFTFTPATNYELRSVEVNGDPVALSSLTYDGITDSYSYTYSSLDRHINVAATFSMINSSIVVKYYVNNTEMIQKTVDLDGEYYYIDLTPSVTIEGSSQNYTYADLSFDKAANGAMEFTDVNDPIPVKSDDIVKLYFLTTAVSMSKTATETTKYVSSDTNATTLGGTAADSKAFTDANGQDSYDNVKQTFEITLDVNSTDMIKGYSKGGNTDIILVLDDSNSMHPDYSTNADLTKAAISEFLNVAFTAGSGNKVAVVRYNSLAGAWNGSAFVQYNGAMSGYSGITYNNCFMTTKEAVTTAVNAALTKDDSNGGTNMEGGFMMAEVVAKTRATSTDRNLLILIFTDGEPTFRYTDGSTTSYDYDGTTTSEYEYNEALAAGQSLRKAVNSYSNCTSFIYSVALLSESTYTEQDYALVENLLGTSPKSFLSDAAEGYYYYTIRGKVDTAANWKSAAAYTNAYFAIKSSDTSVVQQQLEDVFKQIAYTTVPDQYLTGTLVDTIPANFKLTAQSASALKSAGWTITENTDGTTTISKSGIVADNKESTTKDLTYEVVYQGGGYGAVYTNTSAQYTYTDILTGNEVVGTFTKPVVEVIPWTVNDHATAMLGTDLSIDIKANDLFAELTAGGYTVVDYKIRLTDAKGKDATYYDAVEQLGCKFDAVLNTTNQTVSFYTLTGGTHTFYYVVEAKVKAPDKGLETVYSRVTAVDVTVPNVDLTKTATEVTKDSAYAADVTSDAHGNVQQLYLITLKIAKQNASDTIQNGVLTDVIPEGFTFVRFVAPTSDVTHNNGVITYSGIAGDMTLQFLVRYTGNNSGVLYTNTTASFKYDFVSEDGTSLSIAQYFKQPVAGIDPATVNDVDIVKSGDTQTIDVMANDLFTKDGMTLSDYIVSDKVVHITDKNGAKLTQEQIDALGISLCVNDDGTVTYTTPKQIGDGSVYEFYYVVEANVTLPDGSTYAENNSTALTSRPTKVTIYSVEDQYIVVDFGLPTVEKAYGVTKDTVIANDTSLTSLVKVSGLQGSVLYGTMSTSNGKYSFCPTTMNFSDTSYFSYTVKLEKGTYNAAERSVAGGVTVVPANNVYYEENFIRWVNTTVVDENEVETVTNEWMNVGTAVDEKQAVTNILYGYDSTYEPESGKTAENYSNGSEKSVTVNSTAYEADAYFTFSGTGFDIYSECGKNSGVIVAEIYQCASQEDITKDTKPVKVILMDTYLNSDVSYYQIPVVMCRELNYNIYTVKIRAFYNAIFDHNYKAVVTESKIREVLGLDDETELICGDMSNVSLAGAQQAETRAAAATSGQYNVYVDAVRIYNPLGTLSENSGIAYTAYSEANELNPTFENINDTILDANNATKWADTASGVEGALYIASGSETAKETDVFDDQTVVCLGAAGTIKTVTENGKDYLLDKNGDRIQYEGADVYVVSVAQNTDNPNAEQAGIAFYYDNQSGDAIQLNRGQLSKLNIYCYENKYDAIGPENEVYLRNGQGLAFNVPANTHIQISAKMPFNSETNATVKLYAYRNGSWTETEVAVISSRTEMYYDLTGYVNSDNTLIIKCVSSDLNAVLALCNVKGNGDKGRMITFNGNTLVAAMNAFYPTAEEHTHSYTDVVTEPTCTEKGFTTYTCECGYFYVDTYVDALGHAWDKGVVTLEPTATEDGVRTYTCERCGETKTEVIKATAETPADPSEDEKPEEKPCDGGKDCPSAQFSDVNVKEWYHESVDYVVTHDLMNGVTGGKFDPEGEMNRAMLVTVLWRYEGKPTGAKNTFSDVPTGEWYTDAVAWAAENGIVNGIGDGKFDPLGKITREQMATILCRYTENRGITDTSKHGDLSGFSDEKQISAYATDAVAWAVGEGLILGSEGMLLPQGNATRAQVATILMRYIENIAK